MLEGLAEPVFTQEQRASATADLIRDVKAHDSDEYSGVQSALDAGADPNATLPTGETVIGLAAKNGDWRTVEQLHKAGALLDSHTRELWDKFKAQVKQSQAQGELGDALLQEDIPAIKKATQHGARFDLPVYFDDEERLPLESAIRYGAESSFVAALLYLGANPHIRNREGVDMVSFALKFYNGDLATIRVLQGAGVPTSPRAALIIAILKNDATGVHHWLRSGVLVEATTSAGDWTPLQWAASQGNISLVTLLLKRGANPNAVWHSQFGPRTMEQLIRRQQQHAPRSQKSRFDQTLLLIRAAQKRSR